MFPVEAARLREQIWLDVVAPALADNRSAYRMDNEGGYTRCRPAEGEAPHSAQAEILARATGR